MKEKLQEYALVAEIISAIAIVASLVFVGLQIRLSAEETSLNTRSIQGDSYQGLIEQLNYTNLARVEYPQFAELMSRYQAGEEIIIPAEINQMNAFFALNIRYGDLAFRQFRNGLIDEQMLNSILGPIWGFLSAGRQGLQQWENLSRLLDPEYVRYLDQLLETESEAASEGR